jgi:AraC family transcriptional regulator of adaptative response/methylated-DNA-[protein]-cysteine methyltransferase
MSAVATRSKAPLSPHADADARWQAVVRRDKAADGSFVFAVRTTGVFCRPGCPSRLPRRENVRFYATCQDAQRAGYRPCKRCRPAEAPLDERHAAAVERACRLIEAADQPPPLAELADSVRMSPHHLHRLFKAHTGVTPRAYAAAHRARRLRDCLAQGANVTAAMYAAGFNASSRFYQAANGLLGMKPRTYRAGGKGVRLRFAVGKCWLGAILVAASDRGVAAIMLGDDPDSLPRQLADRFPRADLIAGDARFQQLVAQVVRFANTPSTGLDLPLDIRGTAFERRVWQALRGIPAGTTVSYRQLAARIGRPKAARAVGRACGRNPLALAIPCHRAVRSDGSLAGYRWGVERKQKLIDRERVADP